MYAVVRIRGEIGVWKDIRSAFQSIGLRRKHSCVLLPKTMTGQLQKVRDYCTWGEVSDEMLLKMLEKRCSIGGQRVTKAELKKHGFKDFGEMTNKLKEGQKVKKLVFRLTPPSKGFRHSIKHHYPKGELGYRGDKINELLERMI